MGAPGKVPSLPSPKSGPGYGNQSGYQVRMYLRFTRASGTHGQGTVRGPPNKWYHFVWGSPGPSEPLDTVHPVHPLATPLLRFHFSVGYMY